MRIEPTQSQTVAGTGPLPVEPWMKKQIEASFQRLKGAILSGNFSAFLAEHHPDVLKARKVEEIAIQFGELKAAGVGGWELDSLHRDHDSVGALIKNAPKDTVAIFAFQGKDQLKFGFLGQIRIF